MNNDNLTILRSDLDTLTKQFKELSDSTEKNFRKTRQGIDDVSSQVDQDNFSQKKIERKQLIIKNKLIVGDHDEVANMSIIDGIWRIWAGKEDAATAPFRVDKDGNVVATAMTVTGGVINYGKTSFTDATNAGYYISSSGIYMGSASDAAKLKYTVATGAFDITGTITGGTIQTAATGQRVVLSGADNSLRFYNSAAQVIGIGTTAGNTIDLVLNSTTNNGIVITSTVAGNALYFTNASDVGSRGLYVELTSNGSNNVQPCIELHHDGHYYAEYIQATHNSGGIIIDASGAGDAINIINSGTMQAIDINNSGNGIAVSISQTGTGNALYVEGSNTGGDNAVYITNSRGNTAALYVTKSASYPGRCVEVVQSVNSATAIEGIVIDLANAGAGLEHAFAFVGSESGITAAGNSGFVSNSTGTFTAVGYVRIKQGASTYYMPYGTIA